MQTKKEGKYLKQLVKVVLSSGFSIIVPDKDNSITSKLVAKPCSNVRMFLHSLV